MPRASRGKSTLVGLMIVGAQKAGTSSLLHYVSEHPGVCTHRIPEIRYFCRDSEYNNGFERTYQRYFECDNIHTQVVAAKSVNVMYSTTAIQRLHNHNPEVHIVISLRHPVDRAYSAYWFAKGRGLEYLDSFEAALAANPSRFGSDLVRKRECAYLDRSLYVKHISNLLACFKRDQMHIFLMEDLMRDAVGICRELYSAFDELDSNFTPQVGRRHNPSFRSRSRIVARLTSSSTTFPTIKRMARRLLSAQTIDSMREMVTRLNTKQYTPPPMNPETRAQLIAYFEPYNVQLSELLGRDLGHWNFL